MNSIEVGIIRKLYYSECSKEYIDLNAALGRNRDLYGGLFRLYRESNDLEERREMINEMERLESQSQFFKSLIENLSDDTQLNESEEKA